MNYNEFKTQITELAKIKLTNYRLTTNDIANLISLVFEDIASQVNLDFYRATVAIDSDTNLFDTNPHAGTGTVPNTGLLIKVEDERGMNISKLFKEVSTGVYTVDYHACVEVDDAWLVEHDGEDVVFIKELIPDVTKLTPQLYSLLLPVVLEGIIYHAQDAIPNPTSSNVPYAETGAHDDRYNHRIQQLKNKLPQVV